MILNIILLFNHKLKVKSKLLVLLFLFPIIYVKRIVPVTFKSTGGIEIDSYLYEGKVEY